MSTAPAAPHHGVVSRERLAAVGKTTTDVRAWAIAEGHILGDRGLLPTALVTAYLATLPAATA